MNNISYNKNFHIDKKVEYLFPINMQNLAIYFAIKKKHEYDLANISTFIQAIANKIPIADFYIIPESSSNFLKLLLDDKPFLELKKNNPQFILNKILSENKFSKEEIKSLTKQFNSMNNFKIHKMKSNKRKYATPFIFQNIQQDISMYERICILDDISITATTLEALAHQIKKSKQTQILNFTIFKEIR